MKHFKMVSIIATALCLTGFFGGTARAEREHAKDIAAFASVKTSLIQAIGTVEQKNGGQVVKAEYHMRNRTPVYVVASLSNGKESITLVDPMSGNILGTNQEGFFSRLFDDEADEQTGIKASKLTLRAAVTMAEQQTGGKAIEAGFKDKHGKPRFEIALVKNGASQEIVIDGTSGQIIKTRLHNDEDDD
ncbi:Propeptide PepSY amd peptidase M4 [Solidesulfovibrio fructosivorans JJ]]|uniref:Propeptide PepSY amd peptidase M4 n=1 Tax=Solidesulfovibrio fructosivorans JJ] TaxID=596151 RepID=E1JWW7_SOLFR|nr:PepSY domain-containing protein [Solidesulfovibrio fructosivorans]EFL51171.1 Propeptide PepSY amd peptidase M4 [Solidesulfovibrio fructosivorans JJ]]